MVFKNRFWIFYAIFAVVTAVVLVMNYILVRDIDLTLPGNLFMDRAVLSTDESVIIYISGENVSYAVGQRRYRPMNKDTRIVGKMTIKTGADSSVAFRLKSVGIFHLYPNSVVYIPDIGRFILNDMNGLGNVRYSECVVETGRVFMGINTYSDNSSVLVKTSSANLTAFKGKFFVDCENDFVTKVVCIDGDVMYRPASLRYDNVRWTPQNTNISIERLLAHRSHLQPNKYVRLTHNMAVQFDNMIDKVCNSSFFPNLDSQSVTDSLSVASDIMEKSQIPQTPYILYQNHNKYENTGFVEINVGIGSFVEFNELPLNPGFRYVFLVDSRTHEIITDVEKHEFTVRSGDFKVFSF